MILRIIDKVSGLFIRDDFEFNPEIEIGLSVEPDNTSGLVQPKWDFDNSKWVEGYVEPAQS